MWGFGKWLLGWLKHEIFIDYVRVKCQDHVGENGIKIRLTVCILRAKWWKTHFWKSCKRTGQKHTSEAYFRSTLQKHPSEAYFRSTLQKRTSGALFRSRPEASQEAPVPASPVSRSCVFFTYFCFELAFGVNMKVLDNFVSFLMALVSGPNDF